MLNITERLWTLTSPWAISTSPLDGGPGAEMVHVLDFVRSADAFAAMKEHNTTIASDAVRWAITGRP